MEKKEKNIHIATYQERSKKLAEALPKYPKKVVIRLGGEKEYEGYDIQVNSAQAVKNCIDKLKMKEIFLENKLPTMPLLKKHYNRYPCVLKAVVRSGGRSVLVAENKHEYDAYAKLLKKGYYTEPYFDYTSEYRLHCTQDEMFFAVKKIKRDEHADDLIITEKNHYNTREFVKPRLWKEMQKAACEAVKALGLDIGAVDIGYSSRNPDKHAFIIHEVNTNPELLKNTFDAYTGALDKIIKKRLKA
jgi:glutathione synthase/RimK-type ligase-like ATP-grasp enzyme